MTSAKIKVERHKHKQLVSERMEIGMLVMCLLCAMYVGVHVLAWIAR